MAPIKFHGNPLSTATMRVLAAIYEKELDHEFDLVDMGAGEDKNKYFPSHIVRKIKTFIYLELFKDQVEKSYFQSLYFL
jgi:hypothetical protein